MAINLAAIKPNVVSRDIGGYSFLFYGGPKSGKTTISAHFKKSLICAFEIGFSAIPGVMAQPINTWAEFLQVLNQLNADNKKYEIAKAKGEHYERMFDTIVIDIADIAFNCCEKYILAQQGVDSIKDVPFGAGYSMLEKEFDSKLRSIVQMNYGLILISHEKLIQREDDPKEKYATVTLGSTAKKVCTRLVDVYGYITVDSTEDGYIHTLHVRKTPEWDAGSRFKYMQESIPLSYNALVDAIHDAIDKEAKEYNGQENLFTNEIINNYKVEEGPSFDSVMASISENISRLMDKNPEKYSVVITGIVEKYLGKNAKVSQATPAQIEHLVMIELELKEVE